MLYYVCNDRHSLDERETVMTACLAVSEETNKSHSVIREDGMEIFSSYFDDDSGEWKLLKLGKTRKLW